MRLIPGSLRWRTLLVVVLAMVLSQATAMWLWQEYVTRPRGEAAIRQFVLHLKTVHAALQAMGPAQQDHFIERVAEQEGIRIRPVLGVEAMRPAPDRAVMRLFRERLREHFGPEAEVFVGEGEGRTEGLRRLVWVRLPAGEREFWVAIPRARVERETGTAFVAWGIAGLAIAILATLLLVWRLNRPLNELVRAAAALGRGRTPQPVAETGPTEISTAAEAAEALRPLAGDAAAVLFALGVIGVGFLAVPVMTTGAAYDLCQVVGWKHSLHAKPAEAKKFYAAIGVFTVLAMMMNFFGFNPMRFLVFSGVVQGFSTPPLLLLIMLMTNNRKIMGDRVNSRGLNILGWATTVAIFAATAGLVITWFL